MSIEVMTQVWKHSKQRGAKLLILLALADFANDESVAWPSVDTLAKKARCSRRRVQDAIRDLQDAGELSLQENAGPNGVHLYQVTIAVGGAETAPGKSRHRQRERGVQNSGAKLHPIRHEPSLTEEPSLTRPNGREQLEQNGLRKLAEETFTQETGVPAPPTETEKQRKAAGELWWANLRLICEMVEWKDYRVKALIREAVGRMRDGKLTISSPKSIVNTCRAIIGETNSGIKSGPRPDTQREWLDRLRAGD